MRARYYDPEVGQFISEDPGQDGVNWYCYVEANPTNKVDADGRWSLKSINVMVLGLEILLSGIFNVTLQFLTGTVNWYEVLLAMGLGILLGAIGAWARYAHYMRTPLGREVWEKAKVSFRVYFAKFMGIGTETSKRRWTLWPIWRSLGSATGAKVFTIAYNTYIAGYLLEED